jgi:hypothetical protein
VNKVVAALAAPEKMIFSNSASICIDFP